MSLGWVIRVVLVCCVGCVAEQPIVGPTTPLPDPPPAESAPTDEASPPPLVPGEVAPLERGCLKQDDCPEGLVCVARTLRELVCVEYEPAPPRTGPKGRPVPPVGLLDGSAMRRQMGAAR
jgi:hypothetical protein